MWDHQLSSHEGDININPTKDYNFALIETHQDPLSRQILESVTICEQYLEVSIIIEISSTE